MKPSTKVAEMLRVAGINPAALPSLDINEMVPVPPAPARQKPELDPRRLGRITASQFGRITRDRSGKGWGENAKSYMAELIWEWITGEDSSHFGGNAATDWGERHEREALRIYAERTGTKPVKGFYLAKGFQGLVGATPDGVTGKTVEAKSPYGAKAHIYTLLSQEVPNEYKDQVYGQMMCADVEAADFVSYDPRIYVKRPDLGHLIIPVETNTFYMEELTCRIYEFEEELIKKLDQLDINWR